jgi:diguanylate cyclase (GGDEF)-like protein
LASRIGFFVFAATLASALAVAGTSALAVRAFLRSRVEGRIPEAAAGARDRLDLWYAQRALDVEIFSHSDIVVDSLGMLARGPDGTRGATRTEVEQYLGYVRDGLPFYSSIFALSEEGALIAQVGEEITLPLEVRRRLAGEPKGSISGLLEAQNGGALQVVSAPIPTANGVSASLHAAISPSELRELLERTVGESSGRLHLFDERGALVASSLTGFSGTLTPKLAASEPGGLVEYSAADGVRVVASVQTLTKPRWRVVYEGDYGATFAPIASILTRTVGMNLGIVLVLAAAAFATSRYLLRPLQVLSDCAIRLRDGEKDVRLPMIYADHEVGLLARSFAEMVESLTRARETLEQLAITDGLTKIHNHRFFQDQLASAIRRAEETGSPLALILLDIDDFKALNDSYGHVTGDGVLEDIAALLTGNARPRDLVARYGGEEFVVLAPDLELEGAVALAEQIRLAVYAHGFRAASEARIRVTVSIGVAIYQGNRERFFADADRALYAAKHAGKDCVHS